MKSMPDAAQPTDQLRESEFREATDPWSVPVFRSRFLTVRLSYLVFVVAAIISGVTLSESLAGPETESLRATAIASAFWISGWLVQGVFYTLAAFLVDAPVKRLSIGLFGVRAVPRKWSSAGALAVALASIASLIALASFYRWIDAGFQSQRVSIDTLSIWTPPSVGMTRLDSPWLAGAWLCWFQAIFQMFPLSFSLGRQTMGSLVALATRKTGLDFQVQVLRFGLRLIALATAGAAIGLYLNRQFPAWPIVLLLAITIWVTSQAKDVIDIFVGFQRHASEVKQTGIGRRIRRAIDLYQGRRRSQLALQRERGEAVDAARLDEVLQQLYEHGVESLSKEDRQLLKRVSERVRQERDADSSAG